MKTLTRNDIKALTADQKLELLDLISESLEEDQIPVTPEIRDEIKSRLETLLQDKAASVAWKDVKQRLML